MPILTAYSQFAINDALTHPRHVDERTNKSLKFVERLALINPSEAWFGNHYAYPQLALSGPNQHQRFRDNLELMGFSSVEIERRPNFRSLMRFIDKHQSLAEVELIAKRLVNEIDSNNLEISTNNNRVDEGGNEQPVTQIDTTMTDLESKQDPKRDPKGD
jgi:hypothetical protein